MPSLLDLGIHYKKKYPKTRYVPFCEANTSKDRDDSMSKKAFAELLENETVILEKMDGENTNMYQDTIHARSTNSGDHPSRHWVKGLWGSFRHNIPLGIRICGENLYAKHSIAYEDLESYFMVFGVWEYELCWSWQDTVAFCKQLGLITAPVISGPGFHTQKDIDAIIASLDTDKQEGIVIRVAGSYRYEDHKLAAAKWVRPGHVQPNEKHWMTAKVIPNKLKINI